MVEDPVGFLNLDSGNIIWNSKVFEQVPAHMHNKNSYANPTPVIDGNVLYAVSGDGYVYFTVTETTFTDELWETADAEVRPGTKEFQTNLNLLRP